MPHRLDITGRLHARMLEIVGTVLPLITASARDADLDGIAFVRQEMVETIEVYCRHVQQLHDLAEARAEADAALQADALAQGCSALRAAYGAFRRRWADRTAIDNWPEYRLSAIVMLKHIRATVRHAEQVRTDTRMAAA